MKLMKKIMALLLVICMSFTFTACGESMDMVVDAVLDKVFDREPEEVADPLTRATPSTSEIVPPEEMNHTARFETQFVDETLYVVFNGIANYDTDYFYAPKGELTLSARATGEATGMKSFKIALWEKLAGETQYVADTTIYFYTNDETNTYTITGLDPEKQYRMNLSYDAYGYYIFGKMQVDGAAAQLPVEGEEVAA